MSWVDQRDEYDQIVREIDPACRITTKDAWIWRVIAALVMLVTFGGIGFHEFLERFATTIGPVMAYPRSWDRLSTPILVHEARHVRQARWCGAWIHPWAGLPIFGALYLFLFLPLGFSFFRWRFEVDADRASYRWMLAHGYSEAEVLRRAERFGKIVCGGHYGWAWIFGGAAGFVKAANREIERSRHERGYVGADTRVG